MTDYCSCGEPMDTDCQGEPRCPMCDGACPCCDDGGMDAQEDCDDPQDDDYTSSDHVNWYQNGKLVLTVPGGAEGDHVQALRAHMEETGWFPNAWFISDHGNAHLIDLS